jgi:hypothetical protein
VAHDASSHTLGFHHTAEASMLELRETFLKGILLPFFLLTAPLGFFKTTNIFLRLSMPPSSARGFLFFFVMTVFLDRIECKGENTQSHQILTR